MTHRTPAYLDRLYGTVRGTSRRTDMLVENAGTAEVARLKDVTDGHFDKIFNSNVKATLQLQRLRRLESRGPLIPRG
ncbi:hypothetical protein [Streptomyces sp. NPDC001604]|uniref:hypothetical protein n=1 Tax=Streptomyces sp. NPDC001604 TaxID=3364593 RepID=UPI0036C5DA99